MMLERERAAARSGQWEYLDYVRFADDLVILAYGNPGNLWRIERVQRLLTKELEKLELELNLEKTRVVDLKKGESFHFLGFDFMQSTVKQTKERKGIPLIMKPRLKKRTELLRVIRDKLRQSRHLKVTEAIQEINPILTGWVNYFRVGNSAMAFQYVREHVEMKIRRFAMKARKRPGYGWNRWSNEVIYGRWGLYSDYRVCYLRNQVKAYPS